MNKDTAQSKLIRKGSEQCRRDQSTAALLSKMTVQKLNNVDLALLGSAPKKAANM